MFKMILAYFVVNQILSFFKKGQGVPGAYRNSFLEDEPFVLIYFKILNIISLGNEILHY